MSEDATGPVLNKPQPCPADVTAFARDTDEWVTPLDAAVAADFRAT